VEFYRQWAYYRVRQLALDEHKALYIIHMVKYRAHIVDLRHIKIRPCSRTIEICLQSETLISSVRLIEEDSEMDFACP
jgi:hypothetical protein